MTTFKSTLPTDHKIIVIKLGGSTLEGLTTPFYEQIKALQQQGYQIVITHGGGPAINRSLAKMGISSTIIDGLRVTTNDMIAVVQQTLIGEVNPFVVAQLNGVGIAAVGLNGFDHHLIQAKAIDEKIYGQVGEVVEVNTSLIHTLLNANLVPVIACIGVNDQYKPLNINGDTVACQVAKAINAESLLLVTDVAGIRIEDKYQAHVTTANIYEWIEQGYIYGGMIPKVKGALQCIEAGIPSVQIVNEHLTGTKISEKELVK